MQPPGGCAALVLSGGGMRGAYEAGIVRGIIDVLGRGPGDPPPFRIYSGTSVGAINITFLAANSHRGDLHVDELVRIWTSLDINEHLVLDPLGLWGWPRWRRRHARGERVGRSLLDPRPLERLVASNIDWARLHDNIATDRVRALVVAALDIATGRTSMFAEMSPQASFRESRDPRRRAVPARITADHVLASSAIPLMFPARRIGASYFVDGGLRFNTPISPAIRTGADRLLVVSLLHQRSRGEPPEDHTPEYPSLAFLLGKLLNALLLDPIVYDLQVLERFNRLLALLDEALTPEEMQHVRDLLSDTRGASYRRIDTLVFTPSQDIGVMAADHIADNLRGFRAGLLTRWLLSRTLIWGQRSESDLASYLLFDGAFAAKLIELGRRDARSRAEEIRAFFDNQSGNTPT